MTSDTPEDQVESVKSAAQAQPPAGPQLAGTDSEAPQPVPQSPRPTLESIEPGKFPHDWWQTRFADLKSDRDTYARVCASYVMEDRYDMAKSCAEEVEKYKQELEEHLQLFRDYQAQMDTN